VTDPTDDLVAALRTIRTCWPVMLTLTAQQGQRGGDPARPPIPAHILSVRRETAECLASWARLAIEERDLHPQLDAGDAHAVAGFLITHSEWLVAEAEDAVVQEVSLAAARCLDIAERNRVRRYERIGKCPAETHDEDGSVLGPCPGKLVAYIRAADTMLPQKVACDGPEMHVWEPWQWPALGRHIVQLNGGAMSNLLRKIAG
jgi:hypothetical protein